MSHTKSLEELNSIKKDICIRMDHIVAEAAEKIHQINAFSYVEESDAESVVAIEYLQYRYQELMAEFKNCNDDLIRLTRLIKSMSPLRIQTTEVHDASTEEFLERIQRQYGYQIFDISAAYDDE